MLMFARASDLSLELGADLLKELCQAIARLRRWPRGHPSMGVVHDVQ